MFTNKEALQNQGENQFLLSNLESLPGQAEKVQFHGKEHLKVPAVLLKETVLNYPGGRKFLVPNEEIEKSATAWNGEPIVAPTHPTKGGAPISANNPEVLEQLEIGRIFNARAENGKLKADLFFDLEKVNNHPRGDEILENVKSEDPSELSTGYTAPGLERTTGTHKGQEFNGIQRDLKPDHLAVLLDEKGNFSVEEGAGFPRTNSRQVFQNTACYVCSPNECDCENMASQIDYTNARSTARTPEYEDTETIDWGGVEKTLTSYIDGYFRFNPDAERPEEGFDTVDELPAAAKRWIAAKTLLGEAEAETVEELIVLPVVNPNTNQLNRRALISAKQAVAGARGATFSGQQEGSVRDVVNELLEQEYNMQSNAEEIDESTVRQFLNFMKNLVTTDGESIEDQDGDGTTKNSQDSQVSNESDSVEDTDMEPDEQEEQEETPGQSAESTEETATEQEEEQDYVKVPKEEWNGLKDTVSEMEGKLQTQNKALEHYQNIEQEKRSDAIDTILANSERFKEDQLENMDTEMLTNLAKELKPVSRAGQVGALNDPQMTNDSVSEDGGIAPSPGILLNKDSEEEEN